MLNIPDHPEDLPKYAKVSALEFLTRMPGWVRSIFYHGIFGSIPSYELEGVTERARAETTAGHLRKLLAICLTTVLFSFGGNLLFSWLSGTLSGPQSSTRLFYMQDYHNLILYVLVVPLYVAVAMMLIYSFFISKNEINDLLRALASGARTQTSPFEEVALTARSGVSIAAILIISAFLTANYMKDLTSSGRIGETYWFFDEVNGARSINMAGTYYIIFNYLLLTLTMFCVFFVIANARIVINASRRLEEVGATSTVPITDVRSYFDGFCWVYGYAKVLVVLYSLNMYIWQSSPAGKVDNFDIALIALFIIGVFIVSFPRHMLELGWYRYRLAKQLVDQGKEKDVSQVQDIRPRKILWTAWVCNILITLVLVNGVLKDKFADWTKEPIVEFLDWLLAG